MKLFTAISLIGLLANPVYASVFAPLVEVQELQSALDEANPIILDISGEAYDHGHIEGAIPAPYAWFRGPADNPGQLVPVGELEITYEKLGLTPERPIVIVSKGETNSDFGAAARVYWTLKSSGFTELSVLNGGTSAWVKAGFPMSATAVAPAPTNLDISWNDKWTAQTDEITNIVAGKMKAVLVDARPQEFYDGEKAHDAAKRPGTLPGAKNLPHAGFFDPDKTTINQIGDVAALKASLGIDDGEEVVSFCNTGHWAATNWFALSELGGIENVKLYPGSMVEYSATEHEMANVPGLVDNLLGQFGRN